MRKILIVYNWASKNAHGFGNVSATCEYEEAPSIKNIREMERQIREKANYDNVVIVNIIELAEESEDTE